VFDLFQDGWTPLHIAAEYNNVDVVRILIEKGADINASNKVKITSFINV
jgi:ankyrin repeat protein